MSDLKPWEDGYVAPLPDLLDKSKAAQKGGRTTAQRRARLKEMQGDAYQPGAPIPESANSRRLAAMTEETLTLSQMQFYDRFVTEYLHDFSCPNAWLRAGGAPSAKRKAGEALRTAYVQNRMKELIETLDEENIISSQQIIVGIKKEAFNNNPMDANSNSRREAFKLLAQLKGILVKKSESNVNHNGGVMLVPVPSTQQWEQTAINSQKALKHDVRE